MYGLINGALQEMIVSNYGDEVWADVLERSGVPESSFLAMQHYDDAYTYQLAGAAAEVLDAPLETCLEMFGGFWIKNVATRSFAVLMETTGSNTVDFLHNLNGLHDRITSTFLDYVPPEFRVEPIPEKDQQYLVHYYSKRLGLTPFVIGLLKGLAEHFDDKLQILDLKTHENDGNTHAIFELTVK